MTDRPMARFDDASLEGALRSLSTAIDWPVAAPVAPSGVTAGPDIATRVRVRLAEAPHVRPTRPWWRPAWRPLRRSVLLALVALLALAVVAGAVGLGLPGLRIIIGGPTPTPTPVATVRPGATPTPTPPPPANPGGRMGLGTLIELDQVEAVTGLPVRLPSDPRLGEPDAVWIDKVKGNQIAYVWAASPELPETLERGVGFVLMRFDGITDPGFYEKVLGSDTHLERVDVGGNDGYWITGDPHFFFYIRDGQQVFDENRRWVGDALIWSDGTATYRIESELGRDATIAIAETIQ